MANRQSGQLHRTQIRIKKTDYERIQLICDRLGITMAEYFNSLLQADNYDELLRIARTIKSEPRTVEVSFTDDETRALVTDLIQAVNKASAQTRKIGANVSNLIRDIRTGRVAMNQALSLLQMIKIILKQQTDNYVELGGQIERIFSDEGIQKTEIRYKNGGIY